MKKLLLASAALVALSIGGNAVQAADMPVRVAAPVPVYSWSGCYVGAQVGYKWGESRHTSTGFINGVATAPGAGDITPEFNVDGALGGAEAGCQVQWGSWVFGIEADGSWVAADGQARDIPPFNVDFVRKTSERWLATARGRIGFVWDKWLWYVTGGAAWAGVDVNASNIFFRTPATLFAIERHDVSGWVVGYGTEYALSHGWSVKAESLYVSFDSFRAFDVTPTGGIFQADVDLHQWIWRVGMNYKFDWGKAPVVAKY